MGMVSHNACHRTVGYHFIIACNSCDTTMTASKPSVLPQSSFYTFLSDEELALMQEQLTHEQKKRIVIKQKHILEEELVRQETMTERVVVREDLREVCKQIKKLEE